MNYKEWIKNQECLIVGYWGIESVDLTSIAAVYAIAACEGINVNKAMYTLFPDYADDIHVAHTEDKNFVYEQMHARFNGCNKVLVLFKGAINLGGKLRSIPIQNAGMIAQLQDLVSSKLAPQTSTERQILQNKTPGQHLNWLRQRTEAQALIDQAIEILSRCL